MRPEALRTACLAIPAHVKLGEPILILILPRGGLAGVVGWDRLLQHTRCERERERERE